MTEAGGGHRRLSQAVAGALERVYSGEVQVTIEDLLTLDPWAPTYRFTRIYPWALRYAPRAYGALYHLTDRRWLAELLARGGGPRLVRRLQGLLRELAPDVLVFTHPFCIRPTLQAAEMAGLGHIPTVAVLSELVNIHTSWVQPGVDLYTAATEEARQAAVARGAPASRVHVVGLPVDERFGRVNKAPADLRRELGLDPDRFTVLAVGGGEGAGGLLSAVRAIDASRLDLQVVVVCGRNRRLQAHLSALSGLAPRRVLGFVDNMPELMHAADVVLTKGGPQTIAEALASARPVLVTQATPGQEEGNERLLERHGAGVHVPDGRRLVAVLGELLIDKAARERMARAAASLARPEAAADVARLIMALADMRLGSWASGQG